MDFHSFLRTRRSVRRFKSDPVPDSVIGRILTTATYAPSAHHREPWRFVLLQGSQAKTRLAEALGAEFVRDLEADGLPADEIAAQASRSRQRLIAAPLVIALCLDAANVISHTNPRRASAERTMVVQSVAAAGLQLLLAAHAEGLGGVWVCSPLFAPQTVQNSLDLPEGWEPQALFFMGYPEVAPHPSDRKRSEPVVLER